MEFIEYENSTNGTKSRNASHLNKNSPDFRPIFPVSQLKIIDFKIEFMILLIHIISNIPVWENFLCFLGQQIPYFLL